MEIYLIPDLPKLAPFSHSMYFQLPVFFNFRKEFATILENFSRNQPPTVFVGGLVSAEVLDCKVWMTNIYRF